MKTKYLVLSLFIALQGISKSVLSQTTFTVQALQPEAIVAHAGDDISLPAGSVLTLGGKPAATGGTGIYIYNWSPAMGLSSFDMANPTLTVGTSIIYTLTVTDAMGCMATDEIKITIGNVNNLFIPEKATLKVSPNPAVNIITVDLPMTGNPYLLKLFNTKGQLLVVKTIPPKSITNNREINVSSLAPGLYILYVISGENTWTQKIEKR
jgi:hypothetical protein